MSDNYAYVKRAYSVDPVPGQRVQHTVTKKLGTIARQDPTLGGQYVHVRFDGERHVLPCHPTELDYNPDKASAA